MIASLRGWARALKRDVLALWLAARDPAVPLAARLLAALVAAYALSPVDLIPDFISILGLLDDLLIVPAGIWLAIRLIPPGVLDDLRARAMAMARPASRTGLLLVLLAWAGIALLAWQILPPALTGGKGR